MAVVEVHEVAPERPDMFGALVDVWNETDAEVNPEDPPAPVEELTANLFARNTKKYLRTWLAFLGGEPAGVASFELETTDGGRHLVSSEWLAVRAPLRRRGVARAILRTALDVLADDGRRSVLLFAPDGGREASRPFAAALGLRERIEERCSRVRVPDIDDALVDRWLADGRARVDGYRLVRIGDRVPDELLPAYLEAAAAMVDAPTDDLDYTPTAADEAMLRSQEEAWLGMGLRPARCLVLAPDGSGAGMTQLFVNGHRPQLGHQGDTGVARDHRGHGLGRWLKAENLRWAQERSPGFEVIETWNAQSNPWMLDINVAMGFRPHAIWRGYQGDLDGARTSLA